MPLAYDNLGGLPWWHARGFRAPRPFGLRDELLCGVLDAVQYPPKVPMAGLVKSLKGVSAPRLRSEFTGPVNWHIMHGHF